MNDIHRALAEVKAQLVLAKAETPPDARAIADLTAARIRLEGELSAQSRRHLSRNAERTLRRAAAALREINPDLSQEIRALLETP